MRTAEKDYYKVLGVDEKASDEVIKKAYRQLAKRYHPDANQGNAKSSARFAEVGEAYGVLSDPDKRKKYDRMRALGAFGIGGRSGNQARPGGPTTRINIEDLGGPFSDIFSSLFRGNQGKGRQEQSTTKSTPRKGRNVKYNVEVSFLQAATGGKVAISVPITEQCATCNGSGGAPDTAWKSCDECKGTGDVSFGQGGFAVKRPCPACAGQGRRAERICGACSGSGDVHQKRKIQLSVPPGAENGAQVRLAGQGERGEKGGVPGDLIITFKVKPHKSFRREGLDIISTVKVNIAQAVVGSKEEVMTIWGKNVILAIPPGTQTDTRFRIRGYGIRASGARTGDHIVKVRVEVPKSLTAEQERKFREFASATDMEV